MFNEYPKHMADDLAKELGVTTLFYGELKSNRVFGFAPSSGVPGVAISQGSNQVVVNEKNLRILNDLMFRHSPASREFGIITMLGTIDVELSSPSSEGARTGVITFREPHDFDAEAKEFFSSIILSQACAGVDCASPQYREWINTMVDVLVNRSQVE